MFWYQINTCSDTSKVPLPKPLPIFASLTHFWKFLSISMVLLTPTFGMADQEEVFTNAHSRFQDIYLSKAHTFFSANPFPENPSFSLIDESSVAQLSDEIHSQLTSTDSIEDDFLVFLDNWVMQHLDSLKDDWNLYLLTRQRILSGGIRWMSIGVNKALSVDNLKSATNLLNWSTNRRLDDEQRLKVDFLILHLLGPRHFLILDGERDLNLKSKLDQMEFIEIGSQSITQAGEYQTALSELEQKKEVLKNSERVDEGDQAWNKIITSLDNMLYATNPLTEVQQLSVYNGLRYKDSLLVHSYIVEALFPLYIKVLQKRAQYLASMAKSIRETAKTLGHGLVFVSRQEFLGLPPSAFKENKTSSSFFGKCWQLLLE